MSATQWHAHDTGWRRVRHHAPSGRAGGPAGTLLAVLREWRRRRRNRRELAALDDRTLRDIGLSRGDIDYLDSKAGERDDAWYQHLRFPPF
jgi:uncharacterized protein YjiS (DUF1127 family)